MCEFMNLIDKRLGHPDPISYSRFSGDTILTRTEFSFIYSRRASRPFENTPQKRGELRSAPVATNKVQ